MSTNLLFAKHPPANDHQLPEAVLWWGVIRQAAKDIERGYEQQALDAFDFLKSTGLWLLLDYFKINEDKAIDAIASLVRRYHVRTGTRLI